MGRILTVSNSEDANLASGIVGTPKCIIFDLDGTLINTIDDLGLACDFLLKKHGIEPKWTVADYKNFVGNGARLLVQRAFDNKLSERDLDSIYEEFKIKYNEMKLEHAHIYPKMNGVIRKLKSHGYILVVCTNKPDTAAKGMISALFPENSFDIVQGALDSKPKKPDPTVAREIIDSLGISPDKCLWIGDSSVDIETASNLGCRSIGVTWGFRPTENLVSAGADVIINSPEDILKILKIDIDNI